MGNQSSLPSTKAKKTRLRPKDQQDNVDVQKVLVGLNPGSKMIHLVSLGLERIPQRVLDNPQLEQIFLFNNRLLTIPVRDLCIFTNLSSLDLSFNGLRVIPDEFSRLVHLKALVLSGNLIEDLPESLLNLTELESFKASINNIKKFPHFLLSLPCLAEINLAFNQISEWDTSSPIIESCALTTLSLEENQLQCIPDGIKALKNLKSLRMRDNNIKSISDEIGTLDNLIVLELKENNIKTLPATLLQAKSLKTILLQHNRIKKLPDAWFDGSCQPCRVTDIHLEDNMLKEFPGNFFEIFPILTHLKANNNRIHIFPEIKQEFPTLVHLELGMNKLKSVPGILNFPNLSKLALFGNKITDLPSLLPFSQLKMLQLSYNPLNEIPELPPLITDIQLSGCNLKSIPKTLLGINTPWTVNLSTNEISEIPEEFHEKFLEGCDVLDLTENKFTVFPDDLRSKFRDLAKNPRCLLYLNENPIEDETFKKFPPLHFSESSRLSVGISDMLGIRPKMEDEVFFYGNISEKFDLVGVLDGHGGQEVATLAGKSFLKIFKKNLTDLSPAETSDSEKIEQILTQAFLDANEICRSQLDPAVLRRRVGSTALIGLVSEDVTYIANVGDTRAVSFAKYQSSFNLEEGEATRQSIDHRPLAVEERDRLIDSGAYMLENGRLNGILSVSRSLGDFYLEPYLIPNPHLVTVRERAIEFFMYFQLEFNLNLQLEIST
eukprot:TRINITY_DN3396_c1_g1_i2.p1 TRINITY_DN3396_c1_g1~~TRINITY_DN3396_c1_g1_i2.p1  ORF type:complete len:719 (-),score=245.60 TRINITY_DN3396_c1_g1_i2:239-2395(-)